MKKIFLKNNILVFLILISIILPIIAVAQTESENRLLNFLQEIATLLTLIGGGLALIVVIVSGIMYITSSGDETKIKKAKNVLVYGLIGTAIIVAATFIVGAIEDVVGRI